MGKERNAHGSLGGEPEVKTLLGRTTCRWKDNIKINPKELGCRVWAGFIRLGLGTSGNVLQIWL
jgi:hypothetical protein